MVSLVTYGVSSTTDELEFARMRTVARTKPARAIMRTLKRPELAEAESWLAKGSPSKYLRLPEVGEVAIPQLYAGGGFSLIMSAVGERALVDKDASELRRDGVVDAEVMGVDGSQTMAGVHDDVRWW